MEDDPHHYRLAFIEAFRRRGIFPQGIRTLSEETLRYRNEWEGLQPKTRSLLEVIADFLRDYRAAVMYETDRRKIYEITRKFIAGKESGRGLHQRLHLKFDNDPEFETLASLDYNVISPGWKSTMPNAGIVKDLLERTKGRTLIMNTEGLVFNRKDNKPLEPKITQYRKRMSHEDREVFTQNLEETEHYISLTIDV